MGGGQQASVVSSKQSGMASVFRICIGHDNARVVETGNQTPDGMGRRESRDLDASMEMIAWSRHSTAVGAIDWRRQSVPRGATGHDRGDHGRRKPGDGGYAHRWRQKHDIHVAGVVRARRGERGVVAANRIATRHAATVREHRHHMRGVEQSSTTRGGVVGVGHAGVGSDGGFSEIYQPITSHAAVGVTILLGTTSVLG